jgi:hypothetical protein
MPRRSTACHYYAIFSTAYGIAENGGVDLTKKLPICSPGLSISAAFARREGKPAD